MGKLRPDDLEHASTQPRSEWLDALVHDLADACDVPRLDDALLFPGTTLAGARFKILRLIGRGGMGLVYAARDEQRGLDVALKTLPRLNAANVYRLKNEFRSLADVQHVNLVHLHELFGGSNSWFFTMELIDGEPLDTWLRSRASQLDQARLRLVLPQLYAGIAAIHAAGKLHRDLKPSNVLVTPAGRVVVLDFGLARTPVSGSVGQTLDEESLSGTPAYMAPEHAAGLSVSAASDYYALGVMLFEALTGRLPFTGSAQQVLLNKQRQDAPRVVSIEPSAPRDLALMCDALLARDARARPTPDVLRTAFGSASVPACESFQPAQDELLGRTSDLAALRMAYQTTCSGQAVAMFVTGESGIGKTALCQTFLDQLRTAGEAVVLAGRCHERESVPFKGVDNLVDDLSRFLRKLSHAEACALMPREVYALARIFPALGRIEAVQQAPAKDIRDAQELRLRAFEAFGELLARIRDRRPLVLCIDDAQWLDRDAVTMLSHLASRPEAPDALLLLIHRSDGTLFAPLYDALRDHAGFARRDLCLASLPPEAARDLATRLLGPRHAQLADDVTAEASGSPFFVAELARRARGSPNNARLTLREAVCTRADTLSTTARRLLDLLAVAGRPLTLELAIGAADASHAHLDALQSERFIRRNDTGSGWHVECYHDKIRESITEALSSEAQRTLHAQLLAALLTQQDAEVEYLATHALGAGDLARAAHYASEAAARASRAMAFDRAALLYAQALELGDHERERRGELQTALGDALANAGRGAQASGAYLAAAACAAADGGIELKRRAAEQLLISGRLEEGEALLDEVLRAVNLQLPPSGKLALPTLVWQRVRLKLRHRGLHFQPRSDELPAAQRRELDVLWSAARGLQLVDMLTGVTLSSHYVRLALDSGAAEHSARALASEAWFMCATGGATAKARADALSARSEALALQSGVPETLAWAQLIRGGIALLHGETQRALDRCTLAAETLRERCTGVAFELGVAQVFIQNAMNSLGKFSDASQLAARVDEAARRGDLLAATLLMAASTEARLVQGDVDGVQRHIAQAKQHWPQRSRWVWPYVQVLTADTLLAVYLGADDRDLELLSPGPSPLEKGHFLRIPLIEGYVRAHRAGRNLRWAKSAGADARKLRARARTDARALARVRVPHAFEVSQLLHAGLAVRENQPERAATLLRAAVLQLEQGSARAYAAAAKRRLGQLIGGEEGAALEAQAADALRAMGAVDIEATTRMFTFGIEVS